MTYKENKMTKHKHYELIIAWANGAEIEYYRNYKDDKIWVNCTNPVWDENREYRIKPEHKPDIVLYAFAKSCDDDKKYAYLSPAYSLYYIDKNIENTPNIKLTYDGDTKELKSVEKI